MKKFHINSNGDAGECHATVGNCPFGGDENHYVSVSDARTAFEQNMNDHVIPETVNEKKRKKELQNVLAGNLKVNDKRMNEMLRENSKLNNAVEIIKKINGPDVDYPDWTVLEDHKEWMHDLYRNYEDYRYSADRHPDGSATVTLRVDQEFLNEHPVPGYSFDDFDAEASYAHGFIIEESNMDVLRGLWTAKIPAEHIRTIEPYSYGAYRPYGVGAHLFVNEKNRDDI